MKKYLLLLLSFALCLSLTGCVVSQSDIPNGDGSGMVRLYCSSENTNHTAEALAGVDHFDLTGTSVEIYAVDSDDVRLSSDPCATVPVSSLTVELRAGTNGVYIYIPYSDLAEGRYEFYWDSLTVNGYDADGNKLGSEIVHNSKVTLTISEADDEPVIPDDEPVIPGTGDSSTLILWASMLLLGAAAMIIMKKRAHA